jgi:hypothetical protein
MIQFLRTNLNRRVPGMHQTAASRSSLGLAAILFVFPGVCLGYVEPFLTLPLETNPGWTMTGDWAYGKPAGLGGDPSSGKTGNSVLGVNLGGVYATNIPAGSPHTLTTTALNCSGRQGVRLGFWRCAAIEGAPNDNAAVQVSINGTTWSNVWTNTYLIYDGYWTYCEYSLGGLADNQPAVYLRWSLGPTDASTSYGGWNLDDIQLLAENGLSSITVMAMDSSAAETGSNTATFTLTRTAPTTNILTVPYTLSGQAGTADFLPLSGTATFATNASTTTVVITPVDDANLEGTETVVLTLTPGAGYGIGASSNATITITDSEQSVVTITAADAVAKENPAETGAFLITRTAPLTSPLPVVLTPSGTALLGTDYQLTPSTPTIPAGQASAVVLVKPLNDSVLEGEEAVILTVTSNGLPYAVGYPSAATVRIIDDDVPTVTITAPDADAAEAGADPAVFEFTRTPPLDKPLTVYYGFDYAGSTADWGDCTGLSSSIVIPSNSLSARLTITPVNDTNAESPETLSLKISASPSTYNIGNPSNAVITISDDDPTQLVLTAADSTLNEGGGNVGVIKISRKGLATGTISGAIAYTGTASASDFSPNSTSFTFAPLVSDLFIVYSGFPDTIQEGTETIIVTLQAGAGYTTGIQTQATLYLADHDPQRFSVINADLVWDTNSTVYTGDQGILSTSGGTNWNKIHFGLGLFTKLKTQNGAASTVELYFSSSSVTMGGGGSPPYGDGFGGTGSGCSLMFLNLNPYRLYDVAVYYQGNSGEVTAYDAKGSTFKQRTSGAMTMPGTAGRDYLLFTNLRPTLYSDLGHYGLQVISNPSSSYSSCVTVGAQIREAAPRPLLFIDQGGGGGMQIQCMNTDSNITYTLERSTNMTQWSTVRTFSGSDGVISYTDPNPPAGKTFYRTSHVP